MLDFNAEKMMESMKRPPLLKIPLCAFPESDDYIGIPSIVPFTIEAKDDLISTLKQGDITYKIHIPAGELIDIINNL